MVNLKSMTPKYYATSFRDHCIRELALGCVANQLWDAEGSLTQAAREQDESLPDGPATERNFLFEIEAGGSTVGALWLGLLDHGALDLGFLFEIHIDQDERGQGRGYEALDALKHLARDRGMTRIRLHVFQANTPALRLYRKAGFIEYQRRGTSLWMETNL